MAKRKIYIDQKEFSAKEISQGKNFAKLLTEYKKISIPFYAQTSFILSAALTTIAITGSLIYLTYFTKNDSNEKEYAAIVNQRVDKNTDTSTNVQKNDIEIAKSHQKSSAIVSSSIVAQEMKKGKEKSVEHSKNRRTLDSKSIVKNEKSYQGNSNLTTETSAYNPEKQNTQTISTRLNKNNQPSDNLNSKNDKQPQNVFASQEEKTSVSNNSKNSNAGSEDTKNKALTANDKNVTQNNANENLSNKSLLKEGEIKMENDKPAIINNSVKNLPDSSLAVNPINNSALSKDSVKNTDSTKYELAKKADSEKSFNKRKIVISSGIALGAYGTLFTAVKSDGNVQKDGAASAIYSLAGEYGIAKWIGVGAKFSFDNYFTKRDSTTGATPHAHSLNGSAFVNFHFVRHKRFDLFAGVSVGHSKFAIKGNDLNNTTVKGNGSLFGLYVVPRFYFGKRFGIFANISLAGFNYPSLEIKNNLMPVSSNHSFTGNGLNFGIGAQLKF